MYINKLSSILPLLFSAPFLPSSTAQFDFKNNVVVVVVIITLQNK